MNTIIISDSDTGKTHKYTLSGTNFYSKIIQAIEMNVLEDVTDGIKEEWKGLRQKRAKAAMEMAFALNAYERRTLSDLKTAFPSFRTDYWRAYVRDGRIKGEIQPRDARGRFTFSFTVTVWNLQKPYTYKINMYDDKNGYYDILYGKRGKSGSMLVRDEVGKVSHVAEYGITNDNQTLMRLGQQMSDGRVLVRVKDRVGGHYETSKNAIYNQEYAREKQKDGRFEYKKIGNKPSDSSTANRVGGKGFHQIGNMAAVRLSQSGGKVVPVNAKRIVFFTTRPIRRLDAKGNTTSGRPFNNSSGGWIFLTSRNKTGPGHRRYLEEVNRIIQTYSEGWTDNTKWFEGIAGKGNKYFEG